MATLQGKRVFITGASGFIGRALAIRYSAEGALVSGLDFHADAANNVIGGDLTRPDDWAVALAGVDIVIHTAAIVSNTATMDVAWRVNVQATADLLQHCVAAGVQQFIQLSSGWKISTKHDLIKEGTHIYLPLPNDSKTADFSMFYTY